MKEYEYGARAMPSILDDKARTLGKKVFVRDRENQITYAELSEGSTRIANYLTERLGVVKEDKIAVILPNCVEYFTIQFGIAKAAAVMVPVNVMAKHDLLAHFLNNSDAAIVVIDEQFLPLLDSVAGSIQKVKTLIVRAADIRRCRASIRGSLQVIDYRELFEGASTAPKFAPEWHDPADIFYTSGSTGVSKGVVLSHNHHYTMGLNIARIARMGPEEIMYICLPLYHGMGSYMCIMPILLCGGSIALGGQFSASKWLNEIREFKATVTWSVYSMAPVLMKQPVKPDDADNPLRVFLFSGMPPDIVGAFEQRYGVQVIDFYGSTESADLAFSSWDERRPGAVGPVNSDYYEIAIVDDYDNPVPVGQIGECVSRCKQPFTQMSEYYNMPAETLKAFRNRWLHTGDLCRLDKDGWLYFVGRGKDSIRRRGENISCYELENILSGHAGIEECASIPVPSELGEDEIKVVVAPREGVSLDYSEVMKFCRDTMPKFMVPRYIEMVKEVPKLPNHKIDKTRLKKEGLTPTTWDAESAGFVR